jgi:hypothetical protein
VKHLLILLALLRAACQPFAAAAAPVAKPNLLWLIARGSRPGTRLLCRVHAVAAEITLTRRRRGRGGTQSLDDPTVRTFWCASLASSLRNFAPSASLRLRPVPVFDRMGTANPYPCSRTGVAPVSDIVWNGFSRPILMAVNSHLLVSQWDEDGDRRDACPTPPATPSAWFATASLRLRHQGSLYAPPGPPRRLSYAASQASAAGSKRMRTA